MTALDNASLSNNSGSNTKNSDSAVGAGQRSVGSGRLSLRGQKRALSSDISPAPEPRTSHRIRTNSSGDNASDTNKVCLIGTSKYLAIFIKLKKEVKKI